jgi:hypothetical protein
MAWTTIASSIPDGAVVPKAGVRLWGARVEQLLGVDGAGFAVVTAASTTAIAEGAAEFVRTIRIFGSTTITRLGIATPGTYKILWFLNAPLIEHSSNILCPGNVSVQAFQGVSAIAVCESSDGSTNGTAWRLWQVNLPLPGGEIPLPRGYLSGLICNNQTPDLVNDVRIGVGAARAAQNSANLFVTAGFTKRLDANWTAGTGGGGLDTGAKAINSVYHLHLIGTAGGDQVDAVFSLSATSPTLPSGYAVSRRIASLRTDGSGSLQQFTQVGDRFLLAAPPLSVNVSTVGTTRSTHVLSVPAGIPCTALIRAFGSGSGLILLQPTYEADAAPSNSAAPLYTLAATGNAWTESEIEVGTDASIAARASTGSQTLRVVTRGWIDRRGRDD